MININFDNSMKEVFKKRIDEGLKEKGFDELNRFLLILIILFIIIDIIFKIFIIGILEIVSVVFFTYRLLSKNKYKRVKENRIFLEIFNNIKHPFNKIRKVFIKKKNIKDKRYIYRKCPKCKLILKLKLPKKIGFKHTTCPDCGTRFKILVLRRRKD